MMKKVIILVGSPRVNGSTVKIVEQVNEILTRKGMATEIVLLDWLELVPCRGCGSCEDSGECVQKDEMQELWQKVESSDGLVLASPTYYSGVTAQMKMFIDRTGKAKVIWDYKRNLPAGSRFSKGKRAMVISVCGQPGEKWLTGPLTEMRSLLHDLEIPVCSIIKMHGSDVGGGLFEGRPETRIEIVDATERFIDGTEEIALYSKDEKDA